MSLIVEQEGYQYVGVVCATIFLIPQIILSYKTKSTKDISSASLICVTMSSFLWSFYMYEESFYIYTCLTIFVGLNALALLIMQFRFYMERYNEHMLTFDQPPPAPQPVIVQCPHCEPNLQNVV